MKKICFLLTLMALLSCKNSQDHGFADIDTKDIMVSVNIARLERDIFKDKSIENCRKFVANNPQISSFFFKSPVNTEEDKELLAQNIFARVSNPSLDSVYLASEKVFGDMGDLSSQFEDAFKHVKYYYPKFKEPKIRTIITGFENDKLFTDTSITIGIDFFLGKNIPYAPPVFEYLKDRLSKPYFVHNIMLEMSSKYIEVDPQDETLIAKMIGWGKALYFTKACMPSLPDSIVLGYTQKQLLGAQAHEAQIFNHFIKNNLLYDASHLNDKYVTERPYTAEIGTECPPRIGRWLGYLIVCKYMENNPKLQLPGLMKEKDSKKIFTQSKYKPKK